MTVQKITPIAASKREDEIADEVLADLQRRYEIV